MTQALAAYQSLIKKIDTQSAAIQSDWSKLINCRLGCDSCCRLQSVLPIEAAIIRTGLEALPEQLRHHLQTVGTENSSLCPLLYKGGCTIYDSRPIICRTHGFPLLFVDDAGNRRIDFCRKNFEDQRDFPGKAVLDLDRINELLTGIDFLYCREVGAQTGSRVLLRKLLYDF